ncbi:MAG: hypothetical protein ACRC0L_12865 [Angustibacter sp.]
MPIIDASKHKVPAPTGEPPRRQAFADLSSSINDVIPVADVSERATVAAALGASLSRPVYTHRQNAATGLELEVTTDGAGWRVIYSNAAPGWNDLQLSSSWTGTAKWALRNGFATLTGITNRISDLSAGAGNNSSVLAFLNSASQGVDIGAAFPLSWIGRADFNGGDNTRLFPMEYVPATREVRVRADQTSGTLASASALRWSITYPV